MLLPTKSAFLGNKLNNINEESELIKLAYSSSLYGKESQIIAILTKLIKNGYSIENSILLACECIYQSNNALSNKLINMCYEKAKDNVRLNVKHIFAILTRVQNLYPQKYLECLENALELIPDSYALNLSLCEIFSFIRNIDKAILCMEKCLCLSPRLNLYDILKLADLYYYYSNYSISIRYYALALTIDPNIFRTNISIIKSYLGLKKSMKNEAREYEIMLNKICENTKENCKKRLDENKNNTLHHTAEINWNIILFEYMNKLIKLSIES